MSLFDQLISSSTARMQSTSETDATATLAKSDHFEHSVSKFWQFYIISVIVDSLIDEHAQKHYLSASSRNSAHRLPVIEEYFDD